MNRNFIGVPFRDDKESFKGANCYGLVRLFYLEELDIIIPSLNVPSNHSNKVFATFLKQISEHWEKVEEPNYGDVVAMAHNLAHPKIVQHVGVYLGDGKILHTLNKLDSHISSIETLRPIIKGFYKWHT